MKTLERLMRPPEIQMRLLHCLMRSPGVRMRSQDGWMKVSESNKIILAILTVTESPSRSQWNEMRLLGGQMRSFWGPMRSI